MTINLSTLERVHLLSLHAAWTHSDPLKLSQCLAQQGKWKHRASGKSCATVEARYNVGASSTGSSTRGDPGTLGSVGNRSKVEPRANLTAVGNADLAHAVGDLGNPHVGSPGAKTYVGCSCLCFQ
jgi:hypothetical protein